MDYVWSPSRFLGKFCFGFFFGHGGGGGGNDSSSKRRSPSGILILGDERWTAARV